MSSNNEQYHLYTLSPNQEDRVIRNIMYGALAGVIVGGTTGYLLGARESPLAGNIGGLVGVVIGCIGTGTATGIGNIFMLEDKKIDTKKSEN